MASLGALRTLAETDVRQPIPTEQLMSALQTPPFVYVPGLFNTRDLGLLSTATAAEAGGDDDGGGSGSREGRTTTTTTTRIRPGFLYRTGGLDLLHTHPEGQALLRDHLGVRRIFDLRSREEHARGPDPVIEGVEGVWEVGAASTAATEATPAMEENAKVDLAWFVEGEGERGYVGMYMEVLRTHVAIFREVLRSVRDRPGEPILFHCTGKCFSSLLFLLFLLLLFSFLSPTSPPRIVLHPPVAKQKQKTFIPAASAGSSAKFLHQLTNVLCHPAGKDRTGVLAGLLESLAGYDADVIQTDFLLSRIGYEPAREQLLRFALKETGVDAKRISDLAQLFDVPGFYNLASLKPVYWAAFDRAVQKEYGGFEGYATAVLGFSADDLATVRKNLAQAP